MQLGDLLAQPLQFVRLPAKARELPIFGPELLELPGLIAKLLVLRADSGEGFLLNHHRSSGSDNKGNAEESCFQFRHAHKIQEVEA